MNKTQISAEIVAHSINEQGDELISVLCTFPRIILAEVNTHRMLSKNTSSSRAIPFKKMVEAVKTNPFIPIAWQKEHKGMQGKEYYTDILDIQTNINAWNRAKNNAVQDAQRLHENKVTKQLCNRLLEPFMWTTMLITGPREGWENFFNLRCPQYVSPVDIHFRHKSKKDVIAAHSNPINLEKFKNFTDLDWLKINKGQAEIHLMDLAEKIYDALNESTPKQLKSGEWHIPFENKISSNVLDWSDDLKVQAELWGVDLTMDKVEVSTAMAARTSYTVVGDEKEVKYSKMIELHDNLLEQDPPHSSPMEHCARAMDDREYETADVKCISGLGGAELPTYSLGWCRNFRGFIPYRHIIETQNK